MTKRERAKQEASYQMGLLRRSVVDALQKLPTRVQMAGAFRLSECKSEADLLGLKRWAEERQTEVVDS